MFERAEALAAALARDLERCVPLGMRRTDCRIGGRRHPRAEGDASASL